MGSLGPTELIIIGVVLVLLFGATRLPQTAKGLGQALKIFKKEIRDEDKPQAAAPPQPINHVNGTAGTDQPVTQPVEDSERTGR
ncbi:MAG TPA: twin-arginine translocase TatA/TatE family subunit [Actinopolymorphaceae bacterium]|jgi:sec-independent protein translocase protein TatA|nr:twin-arginine translocase TatA/TatE family subunit [Actinopolymorphaceae bacterium]